MWQYKLVILITFQTIGTLPKIGGLKASMPEQFRDFWKRSLKTMEQILETNSIDSWRLQKLFSNKFQWEQNKHPDAL